MPKLLINEGGQASVFELFDDEATIGRGASNAIQIVDSHASKHHAVIRRAGGRVKLVDLESKNGTRVNGEFRNQRWLQHGDAVSIGSAVLTYDGSDSVPVAQAPAPAAAYVGGGGAVAAPTSRAPAPKSRRDRERERDDDEDDDRPRRSARRQTNNVGTVLAVGGGVIVVIILFILLLKGKGNPPNTMALQYARNLSFQGASTTAQAKANTQAALDWLIQHGDPADRDTYVSVEREIAGLKEKLKAFDEQEIGVAALADYKAIERAFIEKWKNGRTEESLGQDLVKWVEKYKGSPIVGSFLSGNLDAKILGLYKKTKAGGFAPPK